MRSKGDYTLYDVINRKTIILRDGSIISSAKNLGFDYTALSKLTDKTQIANRYILPSSMDRIFTLVDLETGIEYDCITNKTIFVHFNLPYSDNDAKYVYELRRGRQHKANICGKLFKMKGADVPLDKGRLKRTPQIVLDARESIKVQQTVVKRLRSRIRHAIDCAQTKKAGRTFELLGCSASFFTRYIAGKFIPGMSWDNYGKWHFDHIIPCVEFDLTDPKQQKRCFHYTNLQPLWATNEIAREMGYDNYEGNINKNDSGSQFDYLVKHIFLQYSPIKLTGEQAEQFARAIHAKGFRKLGTKDLNWLANNHNKKLD